MKTNRPLHSIDKRGRWHGAALVVYTALTVVMTWPLALSLARAIPGDGFDGWQNYWNLWWLKTALIERLQSPLVTDLLYYPTGVSLYFHTLNPFNGLVSLPVQISGSLLLAYNFVVFISFVLSAYGAFLLALWAGNKNVDGGERGERRRNERNVYWGALAAGIVFGFAPIHFGHLLGHMQVFAYQWIPFTALYLLRAIMASTSDAPRAWWPKWGRAAALAGLFLALAGLCDWYFGLYLALFAGLAVIWFWLTRGAHLGWWRALWRAALPAAVVGGVAIVLLLPMLLPMVREAVTYDFMVRPASDLYILSASALDFVLPNRLHLLAAASAATGAGLDAWGNTVAPVSERTIAVGWVALLLALLGLWKDWRRSLPWMLGALFFALLAMGPKLHWGSFGWEQIADQEAGLSPYTLLNAVVPFMRISRSVSRFALMVQMCVAISAAIGMTWMVGRIAVQQTHASRRKWLVVMAVLVSTLMIAEYWSAPFPMSEPDTPAFYKELASSGMASAAPRIDDAPAYFDVLERMNAGDVAGGAMLNLPMNYDRPGYLLYQTVHGMPLAVAYISREDPRTLTERVPVLQSLRALGEDVIAADLGEVGKTVLSDMGISLVTLDRYKMPGGQEREYTEAVAAAIFGDDLPLHQDDRLTVYTVDRPSVAAAYLALGPLNWGGRELGVSGEFMGRRLGEGAAEIVLMHALPGSSVEIAYSSASPVRVLDGDGHEIALLPASDSVTSATVPADGRILLEGEGALVQSITLVS